MANEVVKSGLRSVAPVLATDATTLAERFNSQIERDPRARIDTLPTLPSHAQRVLMQERAVELHGALRPITYADADVVNATTLIRLFLGGYLNLKSHDPEQTARAYVKTYLHDQPLWAIIAACGDFKNGQVLDHTREDGTAVYFTLDHAPSGARMLSQCRKITERFGEEQGRLSRVLAITKAKPEDKLISPGEQERVRDGLLKLADRLKMGNDRIEAENRERIHKEAQEARDRSARIIEEARQRRAMADAESQEAQIHG